MKPSGPSKTHVEPNEGKSVVGGLSGKEGASDLPIIQDGTKPEKTHDSRLPAIRPDDVSLSRAHPAVIHRARGGSNHKVGQCLVESRPPCGRSFF